MLEPYLFPGAVEDAAEARVTAERTRTIHSMTADGSLLSVTCSSAHEVPQSPPGGESGGTSIQRVGAVCCCVFFSTISYEAIFVSTMNVRNCSTTVGVSDGAMSALWYFCWVMPVWIFPGLLCGLVVIVAFTFDGDLCVLGRMVAVALVGVVCTAIGCMTCLQPYLMVESRALNNTAGRLEYSQEVADMAIIAAIVLLGTGSVMGCLSLYGFLSRSLPGRRAAFAVHRIIPPLAFLVIDGHMWLGAEAFAHLLPQYRRLVVAHVGDAPSLVACAETAYFAAFTSLLILLTRYAYSVVEQRILVPGVEAGHVEGDVAEAWVTLMEISLGAYRWLYGWLIFTDLSWLVLLVLVLLDKVYVMLHFAVRFTQGNLLVHTLPRDIITKVKLSPFLRFCLLTRQISESSVLHFAYLIGTPSARKLGRSGTKLCKRPARHLKDYARMRLSSEELLIPIGQVLRNRPYALEEIAEEIRDAHGYRIEDSINVLRKPIQDSFETYQDAFEYAIAGNKKGMQHLLAMPNEHLYGGVLLKDRQAHSDLGCHVEPDLCLSEALVVDALIADGIVAQRLLKACIAPGTLWAEADMGPAWKAAMLAEHPDDPSIEKQLRSTRSPITLSDYKAGMRPARLVKVNASLCDEAFDPGIKDMQRIKEKANQKYLDAGGQPMYHRVRDIARLGLLYDSPSRLRASVSKIKRVFKVVEIENRFASPTALGWRDVTILVELSANGRRHIAELQLQLKVFALARSQAHKHYVTLRKELPSMCKVSPQDLDKVQMFILDRLNSRKLLTELDMYQSNACSARSDTEDADSPESCFRREGVDVDHVKSELLASLQSTVFQRYVIYWLPKAIASVALLVRLAALHGEQPGGAVMGIPDTVPYLLLPAIVVWVDLTEMAAMVIWMIRTHRRNCGNTMSLPRYWSRPCFLAAVCCTLMHQVADPICSHISLIFCEP